MVLQKSVIFLIILGVYPTSRRTHWNLHNIKDYNFIISESSDQFQQYSGNFIYALFPLTIHWNIFPEIHHFVNNLVRSSDFTPTYVNLPKQKGTTFQDTQESLSKHF